MTFYELDPRVASARRRRRWLRVKRFVIAKILRETLDSLPIAFLYYGVPCLAGHFLPTEVVGCL